MISALRNAPFHAMRLTASATARNLVVALAAAAALGAAGAATKARNAPAKSADDKVMTPAQLKECVDRKNGVQTQVESAQKAKAALAEDKAAIDREGTALAEALTTLDRTSAEAVNAHNAKVEDRDKSVEAYQAKVAAYNTQAESVNSAQDEYAKLCADRRYDDRDLADIKRKKKP